MKTIIGYVRNHGEESKNNNITEQEDAIRKYAKENDCEVLEVFRDKDVSGKTFDRKGLQAMLKYIEANPSRVKSLIVLDITRLSRSTNEFGSLKDLLKSKGVKLISLAHSVPKHTGKHPE